MAALPCHECYVQSTNQPQVLCATCEDEPRFRQMITDWIDSKEVPSFPAFVSETKSKKRSRERRYMEEAEEAEQAMREIGADTSKVLA